MKHFFPTLLIILFFSTSAFAGKRNDSRFFKDTYIRKTMVKALDWQLEHPKHQLYDWTNGAFYAGVFAAWETTGSKKIWKALYEMGEANQWKPGPRLHHADDHAICQTYVDMYRVSGEEKMIEPFRETMREFVASPYNGEGMHSITWWWCDALFMAPPAFVKLAVELNDETYFKLSDQLWKETYNLLWDNENRLYARDASYKWDRPESERKSEANGEKIFWSRGNGWVMGGLVRTLEELPADYPRRDFYVENFKEMAARIADLQQADGLWRSSLLNPSDYPGGEASGSGFYTYALAWGINHGILDRDIYLPVVQRAWVGLNSLIQPRGQVGWCQPIGADPKKNFNAENWEVYGTGAFLLAGSEVIKLFD